jgi:serine/threonine-protein kinase
MIGKTISHYKIIRKIGGGGMGVVYEAEDLRLGRTVALKFLPPDTTRDERAKKRFLHEAQAASLLDHPNICSIHEIDDTPEGRVFISMAFYDGVTLKDRIAGGPIDAREVFEIVFSVADGLANAHERGIVHRDIKPANVMITTDGFVKVLDFGLAKLADRSRLTRTGHTPGTLSYMSPEQVTGKDVDVRADIWALGALAYETLTGQLPFQGDIDAAMMYQILSEEPVPPRGIRPEIPKEFETIVNKCLAKDPSQRYQSTSELMGDLASMGRRLGWHSTGTLRSTMRVTPGQASPRSRVIVPLSAAVGVIAVAVVLWIVFFRPDSSAGLSTDVRLAVLPLENLVGGSSAGEFADGLSEWIVGSFERMSGQHPSMWVVPFFRTAPGLLVTPHDAEGAFGVNRVVQGSIQRFGDGQRVALELLDAETQRRLGQIQIDYTDSVADLQTAIVQQSAILLEAPLDDQTIQRITAGGTTSDEAFESFIKGLASLHKYRTADNLDRALASLTDATNADSTYADAHAALALAYARDCQGSKDDRICDQAWSVCQKALELDSTSVYANMVAGTIAKTRNETNESIAAYRRVIVLEPNNTLAYRRMADRLNELDRVDEAESAYREMIDIKPDYWEGYINLGYFLKQRGRVDETVENYDKALSLAPNDWWTLNTLGKIYFERDEWSKARECFLRSFAIRPHCNPCRNIGALYYFEGLYAEAAKYFKFALEYCDSTDFDYYIRWQDWGAALYWVEGKKEEAKEKFDRAVELAEQQLALRSTDARLLAYMAGCYAMIDNRARALTLIDEASALDQEDALVLYLIGYAYEKLGDRERALQYIATAVRFRYSLAQITADPLLEDLTKDIRFQQLIEVSVPQDGADSETSH